MVGVGHMSSCCGYREPIQMYNSRFANECSLCGGVHTVYTSNSAFHPYTHRASVPRPALSRPSPNLLMNYQFGTLMVPAQDSQSVMTVTSTSGLRLSSGVCVYGGGGVNLCKA